MNPSYVNTTGRDNTQNLYDTEGNTKLDPTVLAISHASWDAVKGDMSEVLGVADQSITRRAPIGNSSSTIAGNWLTGLMLEATKELNTVVAFTNSGGIRCDLLANEGETTRTVTVGDIYAITPFGNRLYTYDLTGAELAATVENSFKNSNYGDQFSGMVVKYTAEPDGKDENGRPVRGARTVVSIVLDDGTVVDIKDNTKTYRVAVNEYCATLPGSVFENKTPVQNVNEAPIDNISAIEALRAIGKANNGKLPLDLTERCVKVELVEEDPCEQYTDLDANAWYAESVHFALVNGLFVGFGDGTFRPEAALSRAMVATVLYRQAGSPAVTGTSTFPDLKDDWYADAVAWAQEAKVVIGDDKGLFRPDDDVTREEMVTMLYRFAASQNMDTTTTGDLSNFTDASSVQSYATDYENPVNLFAADFLGTPPINQLHGVVQNGRLVLDGGIPAALALPDGLAEGQEIVLAVRAESILPQGDTPAFRTTVLERYSLGKDELVRLQAGPAELRGLVPAELEILPGAELAVGLKKRGVFLFDVKTGVRYL